MIGRGAMGNPFVFREIRENRQFGRVRTVCTAWERVQVCLDQLRRMEQYKGPRTAILEARKHAAWYIHGRPGAAAAREKINRAVTYKEMEEILSAFAEGQREETE